MMAANHPPVRVFNEGEEKRSRILHIELKLRIAGNNSNIRTEVMIKFCTSSSRSESPFFVHHPPPALLRRVSCAHFLGDRNPKESRSIRQGTRNAFVILSKSVLDY